MTRRTYADAAAYLQGTNVGVRLGAMEALVVSGRPAAFGTGTLVAQGRTSFVAMAAIELPREVVRFTFTRALPFSAQDLATLRQSVESLRHLKPAETEAWPPLRVRVRTLDADTTIDALAEATGIPAGRAWLESLNHLGPGARLRAGDRIKVVE